MPRAGWKKPESERRLSDLVSVGLLTRVFPPEVVDEVVEATGRREQRHRSLPARVMAYFAVGLALHSEGSYEDVLGLMTDGLSWALPDAEPVKLPSKSAIFQARDRLGAEPVAALFERVAVPLATPETSGAWLAGRRLVAIDGTCVDVADSDANDEHFGRPGVNKGERSAFPQARVIGVAECGTHAIFDAVVGPYTTGENTLAREVIARLEPVSGSRFRRLVRNGTAVMKRSARPASVLIGCRGLGPPRACRWSSVCSTSGRSIPREPGGAHRWIGSAGSVRRPSAHELARRRGPRRRGSAAPTDPMAQDGDDLRARGQGGGDRVEIGRAHV